MFLSLTIILFSLKRGSRCTTYHKVASTVLQGSSSSPELKMSLSDTIIFSQNSSGGQGWASTCLNVTATWVGNISSTNDSETRHKKGFWPFSLAGWFYMDRNNATAPKLHMDPWENNQNNQNWSAPSKNSQWKWPRSAYSRLVLLRNDQKKIFWRRVFSWPV